MKEDPLRSAAARLYENELLLERAVRLANLVRWICGLPELADVACNRRAAEAAAWVCDAWCVAEVRGGRMSPLVVAIESPAEVDLVRGADAGYLELNGAVDDPTRTLAAAAIRACGQRKPNLAEARILREAVNLDAFGAVWLSAQVARHAADGRGLASLVESWDRQREYRYWSKRIEESLSFAATRRLARRRCEQIEGFFTALRGQLSPVGGTADS